MSQWINCRPLFTTTVAAEATPASKVPVIAVVVATSKATLTEAVVVAEVTARSTDHLPWVEQ